MVYVITSACVDHVDGACVDVCPVDAIKEHRPLESESPRLGQLVIDPRACICCAACVPACPWDAIVSDDEASAVDLARNARANERPQDFAVAERSSLVHEPAGLKVV